jgi:hypothetical protein
MITREDCDIVKRM